MPYSNPITQNELTDLALYNPLHPRDGSPNELYMPQAYFLVPPATQAGPVKWRLFDAAYITTGIIDPNRLGTGATGAGNLYLADDQTWKPVSGGGGSTTVRTSDLYIATTNQTNFTITAPTYDFFDVYLNGARLISTEYTISSGVVTLVSPAEAGDEIILLSYSNVSIVSLDEISTVGSDLYLFNNY